MRNPIKLHIKLRRPFGQTWVRFYPVEKLLIDNNCPIQSEAQLMHYIFQRHGPGRYQILAWQKGHEGFWLFWLGDLYENGFMKDINKNKEMDRLEKLHSRAKSYEERQDIEDEMDFEKELNRIDKKVKNRGVIGIERAKAGMLHPYQDI